jgi:hypothetical protein
MADYYSLIFRAISALPQSSIETRQTVYARARTALVTQLRNIQPPVGEADIRAESRALEEAITRIELEIAGKAAKPAAPPPPPTKPAQTAPVQAPAGAGASKSAASTPSAALARLRERAAQAKAGLTSGKAAENDAPPPPPPPPGASFRETLERVETPPAPPPQTSLAPASQPAASRETLRPAAPLPLPPRPQRRRGQILAVIGVLMALIGTLALLAWQFHERPEDQAGLKSSGGESATEESGKYGDRLETADTGKGGNVPVAQKAEMWVASLNEPEKVERIYPANVVWRLENVGGGPGETVGSAIRGDVDIPDAKLKATLLFRKNTDPTLSASHTITISFKPEAGSPVGDVKAIGPIQMRRPDAQSGEKLVGIPVPISNNYFLIGLMRGDPEKRNIQVLRSLSVIDLPFQFADGRLATINLLKGPTGDRIFAEGVDSWATSDQATKTSR